MEYTLGNGTREMGDGRDERRGTFTLYFTKSYCTT